MSGDRRTFADVSEDLTDRQRGILTFEASGWWRLPGAKEQAIRDEFGISAARYYQILNGLLDHPQALAEQPVLVHRLRRVREQRRATRSLRPRR